MSIVAQPKIGSTVMWRGREMTVYSQGRADGSWILAYQGHGTELVWEDEFEVVVKKAVGRFSKLEALEGLGL